MTTTSEGQATIHGRAQPSAFFTFSVTLSDNGVRIDIFLAHRFSSYSRSFFQRLIDSSCVMVNGLINRKQSTTLKLNDTVTVTFPQAIETGVESSGEMPFTITSLYQHEHFLVISKPAGLVTHKPKEGYPHPTLVDWIARNFTEIGHVGYIDRPGIVHRLDKDTSGLMLIARSNYGHQMLTELFKTRAIKKTYKALVQGHPPQSGCIDFPIGRHPVQRTKMTALSVRTPELMRWDATLRDATTYYTVLNYFERTALVEAKPVTGRTHQIRVHLAALGYPIVGDLTYGSPSPLIGRQALHAHELSFSWKEDTYNFVAPLPADFLKAVTLAGSPEKTVWPIDCQAD